MEDTRETGFLKNRKAAGPDGLSPPFSRYCISVAIGDNETLGVVLVSEEPSQLL